MVLIVTMGSLGDENVGATPKHSGRGDFGLMAA